MLCAETTLYESGIVDAILSKDIQYKKKVSLLSYRNFQCDVLLEPEKHMFCFIASPLALSLECRLSLRHWVQAASLGSVKF